MHYHFERFLSRTYCKFGGIIARHPFVFIIVPIIVTGILSTGLSKITKEEEVELLYAPSDSISLKDRDMIEKLFPKNSLNFDISRITRLGNYGAVILVAKDSGTMLRRKIFKDVTAIDKIIRNVTICEDKVYYNYEQLCAKKEGECDKNEVLKIAWKIKDIERGVVKISYPFDFDKKTFNYTIYAKNFGGVIRDKNGHIRSTKAIRLLYYLRNDKMEEKRLAMKWEGAFLDEIAKVDLKSIHVSRISKTSFDRSVPMHMEIAMPLGIITAVVLFIYAILACMTSDWVRSKPWLGIAGSSGVGLAIASTFGLMGFCGVTFNMLVMMVLFLTMGIGMDDAFVLIAAWRRSDATKDVVSRLESTYEEVAIAITITSLTNILSFCIGLTTPFPGIRNFCLYAAIAIMFTYLYQLTFFGGCMAVSGYREAKNLHCLTFRPVGIKGEADKGWLYSLFCTKSLEETPHEYHKTLPMIFLNKLGEVMVHPFSKVVVIFILIIYLSFSFWSSYRISQGLDYNSIFPYGTYATKFMNHTYTYFTQYPHRIQIVINETLDYSKRSIQQRIENILLKLESSPYIAEKNFTESWLRYYLIFSKRKEGVSLLRGINISEKQGFIDGLAKVFLILPQIQHLSQDIIFNKDLTEITASRFMIQSKNVANSSAEKILLETIRSATEEEKNLSLAIYNEWFPLHEQLLLVADATKRTVIIAAAVMLVTYFIFIPNLKLAICVMLAVLSIEIGTLGFMSLWNVNLDVVSMVCLIMCVGFSVDYTSHIAYSYAVSTEKTSDKRFQEALNSAGIPIVQGGVTTTLGVVALAFAAAYSFLVFFKVIFLVSFLAVIHAIFVLGTLFYLFDLLTVKRHTRLSPEKKTELTDDGKKEDQSKQTTSKTKQKKNKKKNIIISPPKKEETKDEKTASNVEVSQSSGIKNLTIDS